MVDSMPNSKIMLKECFDVFPFNRTVESLKKTRIQAKIMTDSIPQLVFQTIGPQFSSETLALLWLLE